MYGIFTYIYHTNQPNVGKHTIHGSFGIWYSNQLANTTTDTRFNPTTIKESNATSALSDEQQQTPHMISGFQLRSEKVPRHLKNPYHNHPKQLKHSKWVGFYQELQ